MMTLKNIEVERGCNRKLPVSKVIGTVPCTSSNCVNGDLLLLIVGGVMQIKVYNVRSPKRYMLAVTLFSTLKLLQRHADPDFVSEHLINLSKNKVRTMLLSPVSKPSELSKVNCWSSACTLLMSDDCFFKLQMYLSMYRLHFNFFPQFFSIVLHYMCTYMQ